jgi:hypothetical protein
MRTRVFARLAVTAAVATGAAHVTSCTVSGPGANPLVEDASFGAEDASLLPLTGGPGIPVAMQCKSSAGCLPGQACCSAGTFVSTCQAGPCPSTPYGPLQLCSMPAECLTPGDTCGALPPMIQMVVGPLWTGVFICGVPDGGSDGSSGDDGGGDAGTDDAGDADSDGAAMDTGPDDTGIGDAASAQDGSEAGDAGSGD